MIYVCEPCDITRDRPSAWKDHLLTEKHKKNVSNATDVCENCESYFVINKKSIKDKKRLDEHKKKCKTVIEVPKNNIDDSELKDEIVKLKEKNKVLEELKKEIFKLKAEVRFMDKLKEENIKFKEENIKFKEENIKFKEENIKLKEEIKCLHKFEIELNEYKLENKYLHKLESDFEEMKIKNELLNEKIQRLLIGLKMISRNLILK